MEKYLYSQKIWFVYYGVLIMGCVYSIYNTSFQVGTLSALYILLLIYHGFPSYRRMDRGGLVLSLYILWCILSFLWAVGNGKITNFIVSFGYTILPACFYYWTKTLPEYAAERWIEIVVDCIFWSMVFGLFLYIYAPIYYGDFLLLKGHITANNLYQIRKIFSGIYGPTIAGSLCAIGALYELRRILYVTNKKCYRFIILSILLLLTARKSAIIVYAIFLIYEFVYALSMNRKTILKAVTLFMVAAIFGIFFIARDIDFFQEVINRFSVYEIRKGIEIRNESIVYAIQNIQSLLIGNGFGMAGHRAGMYNGASITIYDNSYMLILVETGIVGFFLFVLFNLICLKKGIKNRKKCKFELEVVLILLLQASMSNIFELMYLTPIYWFCIGRCARNENFMRGM